jgi:hypothetical protein
MIKTNFFFLTDLYKNYPLQTALFNWRVPNTIPFGRSRYTHLLDLARHVYAEPNFARQWKISQLK